jgi:prepilin-type N-terminal cleavage/methylation domain-containing protein
MSRAAGFTLIELLVTCSILATLAYAVWGAYTDVDRRAGDELARPGLLQLATALRRFHDDTGYWPGEGPWRLAAGSKKMCSGADIGKGGAILGDALPPESADQEAAWLASPANFSLLFERPALCTNHPLAFLEEWNPATQRGWNGPYLPLAHRHWVDMWRLPGNELPLAGSESPAGGVIDNVPALAAGPAFSPGNAAYASCVSGAPGCYLGWRSLPRPLDPGEDNGYNAAAHEFSRHARPFIFLLYDLEGAPRPRVVYWGPDGRYGGTNETDPCLPNATDLDGKDDVVICLAAAPLSPS